MRFALYAAAFASLVPAPALADWQYTLWGMAPPEVIAASGGQAVSVEGRDGERVFDLDYRARATFVAGDIPVEAQFFFTQGDGRLAAVKLIPADVAHCDALRSRAVALSGATAGPSRPFGRSLRWVDQANGDQLLFAEMKPVGDLPRTCHLIYRPAAAG